jgi:hypothetical protein
MPSPKLEPLVLTDDERRVLGRWARRRKTAQARVRTLGGRSHSQPDSSAIRIAPTRLRAPVFVIARER